MRAHIHSWTTWADDTISVEVDDEMLLVIIEQMENIIDIATSEKDYKKAETYLKYRNQLADKLECRYGEQENE